MTVTRDNEDDANVINAFIIIFNANTMIRITEIKNHLSRTID